MTPAKADRKIYNMATMPLRIGHFAVLATGSMEQIIGAALSVSLYP